MDEPAPPTICGISSTLKKKKTCATQVTMVRGEEFPGNGKKGGRFAYAFIGLHTIYYLKFTIFLLNNFIGKLEFSFRRILNLYDII